MSKKLGEPVALARAEDGHTVIGPGAFAVMTDFAWLERANRNARKGKRYREEVRYFHQNLDGNLLDIQRDVRAGTYRTGGYRHLWVQVPKKRLVMALLERVINNPNEPFGLPRGKKPEDVAFESWLYNVGMPIGNLLSQMFANIVLNELDQYCKHVLKIHCYIRYMDDILVLGPDKEQLQQCRDAIAAYLGAVLHLDLNAKTCIRPVSMGIEFVGQRVWATHAVLRKSTALRMKREVRKISEDVRDGVITRQEYERRVASIRGMMDHTNSGALRWRLNEITLNIVGEEYGQLPYGRGNSDRKAVRGGGAAKRDHPRAA